MREKIAFIGAGKMASAIVRGLIKNKVYMPDQIFCTCGDDSSGKLLASETGISLVDSFTSHLNEIEFLVLACKPQQLRELNLEDFKNREAFNIAIISILAGIDTLTLKKYFKNNECIIRTMPNMPGQIGLGCTAYCSSKILDQATKENLGLILNALGSTYLVDEKDMDAITALSGSGPAYIFEFISALINGGINIGLSESIAKKLAIETAFGSISLLKNSTLEVNELRDSISSKGGTTEAALNSLKYNSFQNIIIDAIEKAKLRSEEISKGCI